MTPTTDNDTEVEVTIKEKTIKDQTTIRQVNEKFKVHEVKNFDL